MDDDDFEAVLDETLDKLEPWPAGRREQVRQMWLRAKDGDALYGRGFTVKVLKFERRTYA